MVVKKILLDTNAYSNYLRGDAGTLDVLASAETIFMSIFVLGELYAGFYGGNFFAKNSKYLDIFLEKSFVKILSASKDTAEIFGFLKNKLKKTGTPIPMNDLWIASHAIEASAALLTYDKHFTSVPGLILANCSFT